MVNGTTEFSKWFFREGIEVVELDMVHLNHCQKSGPGLKRKEAEHQALKEMNPDGFLSETGKKPRDPRVMI